MDVAIAGNAGTTLVAMEQLRNQLGIASSKHADEPRVDRRPLMQVTYGGTQHDKIGPCIYSSNVV